ncbi:TMhelix containing protein [Vibrio phage 1.244.A._10N.261.54.C3]|nr:TMhelix containing protein [Vibrio phage 1.244.A._10N.261.54.C3]AUR98822.1 TMhelix containing protein [Vibrio phage 1.255.O._10N.286.45.F1]
MGFFKVLGSLFSSEGIVSSVTKSVDMLVYTDEEKAGARERLLKLYEPFKIAQRYIALSLLFLLGCSWFLAVVVRLAGNMLCTPIMLDGEMIKWWMDDSAWIASNAMSMFGEPFFYSVVFYFGGGAGEGIVRNMKSKTAKLAK